MVEVTLEDQENINTFSKLNSSLHEIDAQIAAKKRMVEDLEEAGNEVMLMDDDTVPFVVGECFVHLPRDSAEEKLEQLKDKGDTEIREYEEKRGIIKAKMDELKSVLYAKFGNTINLEE